MKKILTIIFLPRNVLIAFVVITILHILFLIATAGSRWIVDFYIRVAFLLSHFAFFLVSISNSSRFYKVDKRLFVYSVVPLVVYGLFALYIVVMLLWLYFTCPIWNMSEAEYIEWLNR